MLALVRMLIKRNKIVFIPLILVLVLIGLVLAVSASSVFAPFVYTLF